MSIASIQQTFASVAAQQTSAPSAMSADPFGIDDGSDDDNGAPAAAGGNALTGSGTAPMDSQTLAALLGLTQNDPSDPSAPAQSAHHRHGHHGGCSGGGTQSADQSSNATNNAASNVAMGADPSIAEMGSSAADLQDSDDLSQVLAQL